MAAIVLANYHLRELGKTQSDESKCVSVI